MENSSLSKLKSFIGTGGLVPFEHGYRKPTFNMNGYKYTVTMISDTVVYCFKHFADGTRRKANLPLSSLTDKTLNKLHNSIEKYIEYCKTEA